jgi:hypothetical protein
MPSDPPDALPADARVTTIEHETTSPTAGARSGTSCHECGARFSPREAHTKATIVEVPAVEWANRQYSRVRFCYGECLKQWLERSLEGNRDDK